MPRTPASVVIVTYNSQLHLEEALRALQDDPEGPTEVIVVDNGSTDLTGEVVAGYEVRWLPLDENRGFGAACNAGAEKSANELIVFLNPDTVPAPGWLPPLAEALADPAVGAAMATVELAGRPGHFATSGGALTYYGLTWNTDSGSPIPPNLERRVVPFPVGAAMSMKRELFELIGGFREELFLYLEDTDLGWRIRLRGLESVQAPESRVAHDYEFLRRHPLKLFYLERNRLNMLLANYRWSTLLLLSPVLAAVELGTLVLAVRDGWLKTKLASWRGVWRLRRSMLR
ncbi:MAG: glycosyltransferase family 2 protein, partial [Acidimicrobiia bacterium]